MQPTRSVTMTRPAAALAGFVSGAAALGTGELVAGFRGNWQSPVVGVAEGIIERVPRSVKDFAIEQFGRNDKLALIIGILALSIVFAAVLGLIARRRPVVAMAGFALFALVGMWGSQQAFTSSFSGIVPSLCAGAAGIGTLALLVGRAPRPASTESEPPADSELIVAQDEQPMLAAAGGGSRRTFLASTAAVAVVAAGAAAGGRRLRTRFSASSSRSALTLPKPASPLPVAASGVGVDVEGVSSFFTPNKSFYRIDTAVEVPQVRTEEWELRIRGMVDREMTFTYDDILRRQLVEEDITLTCVSNTVGGPLVGNARWLGMPLLELLDEAGIQDGADQLVGRSVDGWTSGFPVDTLRDGRTALLAIGMNGEPLPLEHGFPARVIVSGIYGYVSATKWITEIEVTTFDAFDAYWVKRGWDDRAPIKIQARIDTPRSLGKVAPGTVSIGGVAWAQTIGISKVEVKIDDGEFAEAMLADEQNANTWRLWSMNWEGAEPGRHRITVRATDADGNVQTDDRAEPFPNGASGWMSIFCDVKDA
jgi:DMSO/TMAO reductase YedYZ molybdopterin-dependent catalytic subunit